MRDLAQIEKLSDSELAHFQDLVRHFLGGRCFVRKDGSKEERWRFVLRYQALFVAYFAAAGWSFEVREDLGAAMARPTHRRHAHLFSVLQTHFVYHLLALHYEATSGTDIDRNVLRVSYGDVLERLNSTLPPNIKPNRTGLEKAWRKLSDFGAISLSGAFDGAPTDVITIHSVIEMVIERGVVEDQIRELQAARGDESPVSEQEEAELGPLMEEVDA